MREKRVTNRTGAMNTAQLRSWNNSAALLLAIFLLQATAAFSQAVKPLSGGDGWIFQPHYSDEFSGAELDREKWDSGIKPWSKWTWRPENVLVRNGRLQIMMRYAEHDRDGAKLYYTSGIVRSKNPPIRYGYFEAKIRASKKDSGISPAFWLYRGEKEKWTEIDVIELTQHPGNPKRMDFNTHVFRHPNLSGPKPLREQRNWTSPWHPSDDFHVYGCEWDTKEIRWYVDGRLVQKRSNDYWDQPLDVVVSMGLRRPLLDDPSSQGFPAMMEVDYVRVWQRKAS
jgi:beta-glucanase (GH16 family)